MRAMRLLLLSACLLLVACPTPRGDDDDAEFEGDDPGECSDGADNDRDSFYDCDDQDCFGSPDCSGDDDDATGDDDDATGDDDDATGDDDDATGDDDDSTTGPTAFMYAHTSDTLYAVDPFNYSLTTVGAFNGQVPLFGVTDLAIDLQGTMWAISFEGTYEVDPTTATLTQRGSWFVPAEYNSLTFLTDGRLLAGEGSTLYEVNLTSGELSSMGTVPGGLVFAGDMVGLPDGLLYCLMAPSPTSPQTSLVVYDPSSGTVVDTLATGQGAMYGVGYAQGTIFGFTEGGIIYEVDAVTGSATNVASAGQPFWGAATNPTRWSE